MPRAYTRATFELSKNQHCPKVPLKQHCCCSRIPHTSCLHHLLFFPQPLCQLSLLCSAQRVKEGEVMSSPPGLHCVLALCHCIARRPQTHVQGTFLYSEPLQLPCNTTLTSCKLMQIHPEVSGMSWTVRTLIFHGQHNVQRPQITFYFCISLLLSWLHLLLAIVETL